jgi:hypothetical protein
LAVVQYVTDLTANEGEALLSGVNWVEDAWART